MVIPEAMAYGVSVVSVDISYGPRDIISHGGGIITRRDVKEMSEAIVGLLSDDILYDKLSTEAPKVSSRYDVSDIMEQWKNSFLNHSNCLTDSYSSKKCQDKGYCKSTEWVQRCCYAHIY